ncbi:hypothetical protein GO491_11045 [Flavobacteriaceae bacterium Ap0902]|nr:hypothetical protein [Flavobacteriaceae bacterium Ap0902]
MLYFDNRSSKNEIISCNSCHNLDTYGVDNLPFSLGDTKELGGRNFEKTYPYFHDGSVATLEDAVVIMSKLQVNQELSQEDT